MNIWWGMGFDVSHTVGALMLLVAVHIDFPSPAVYWGVKQNLKAALTGILRALLIIGTMHRGYPNSTYL